MREYPLLTNNYTEIIMTIKQNAYQKKRELMERQFRHVTGNHHCSHQFRHGVRDWNEPNQTNRLAYKEVS